MDVTKSNFKELKPQIEEAIANCCFAAIDCEFTGLILPEPLHPLDTVAQRYQKLRAGISEYLVVQFGLSLWKFDESQQSYRVKTFNMFTFPDGKFQQRFVNQASCLQFLVQNGFDLNRCVREGLPFLHPQELDEQRKRLRSRQLAELAALLDRDQWVLEKIVEGIMTISEVHDSQPCQPASPVESATGLDASVKAYIQSVSAVISNWMNGRSDDGEAEQDAVLLPACNEFVRMTVYRHLEKKFFDHKFQMEAVRPDSSEHRSLKQIKLSRSDSSPIQRLLQKHKEELDALDDRFGVSSVLKTLARSQKPVVGHNSMRDLLHVIHQFIAPLPEDFGEFQTMCKEIFPVLFDTKHMSVTGTIKSSIRGTRLVDVFNQIKNQQEKVFPMPKVHADEGFGYTDEAAREHEAGFDAWLTGYIFAAFAHHVSPGRKQHGFRQLNLAHDCFKPFVNKLHFGPSLDISTIELDASPAAVNRNDVYIIEWKEPEDQAEARYVLSMVGGAKRCGYGEQLLAFVPSSLESCIKVMRAQDTSLTPCCRLYKWSSSRQNRRRKAKSKSPPNLTTNGGVSSSVGVSGSGGLTGSVGASGVVVAPASSSTSTSISVSASAIPLSAGAVAVAALAARAINRSVANATSTNGSRSRQRSSRGPSAGVDLPKKPKLESTIESCEANSPPLQQSGPFPEASW